MTAHSNAPVIIKRKKVTGGDGHHGGAWKVAYADFVTAMMAFFMLMWLLNATTETQRKGIADYFSPTVPVARISGGGDGAFGGDNVFMEERLARSGTGATRHRAADADRARGDSGVDPQAAAEATEAGAVEAAAAALDALLSGVSGESMVSDDLLAHIVTRVTDEGLVVELFDTPDAALFHRDSAHATPLLRELLGVIGPVFAQVGNPVAVKGHVAAVPLVLADSPVWDASSARAQAARVALSDTALGGRRFARITGLADREPALAAQPMDVRNNRLEVVLLRE